MPMPVSRQPSPSTFKLEATSWRAGIFSSLNGWNREGKQRNNTTNSDQQGLLPFHSAFSRSSREGIWFFGSGLRTAAMVDSNRFKQNHTPYTGFPPIGYNVLHVRVCKSYCQLYAHTQKIQVVYLPTSPDNGQSPWVFLIAQLCTEIAGWVVLIRQTPPNCSGPAWWRKGPWNPWIGCLNHPWLFVGWSLYVGWIYYELVVMISSIYNICRLW